jgi:hypothetical protein
VAAVLGEPVETAAEIELKSTKFAQNPTNLWVEQSAKVSRPKSENESTKFLQMDNG